MTAIESDTIRRLVVDREQEILPEWLELLKKAGVDMTSPEPVRQTCLLFENYLKQMEELLG